MEIDTSISPSIDPSLFDVPQVADTFTIGTNADGEAVKHQAWVTARSAAESVFGIAGKLSAAEQAIRNLGSQPDAATDVRLRRGARQQMQAARAALDAAYTALGEHATALESEAEGLIGTEAARVGVTENARAAEARAILRGMTKPSDRSDLLQRALQAGDREFIAGVLASGSPILSGLTPDAHANLRAEARARFAPDQDRLLSGIDRLASMLRQADDSLTRRFASITGEGNGRVAAAERALSALEGSAA